MFHKLCYYKCLLNRPATNNPSIKFKKLVLIVLVLLLGFVPQVLASSPLRLNADAYYALYPDDRSRGLQEAIDAISSNDQGGSLYFPSGLYKINRGLKIYGSIRIEGAGRDSTIIEADPDVVSTIIGHPMEGNYPDSSFLIHETTSVQPVTMNNKVLTVDNAGGFKPGDSIVLISNNETWPFDPRPNVHPGEINRIQSIQNNSITFDQPLRSNYPAGITVRAYKQSKFELSEMTVRFSRIIGGTICLQIANAENAVVQDCAFSNSGVAAIQTIFCHGGLISSNLINNTTFIGNGFGYGIQAYGSAETVITGNIINNARRGIDLSGNIPSRKIIVSGNQVFVSSNRAFDTSGIGTHGSAESCEINNNQITGGVVSIFLRGKDIVVKDNQCIEPVNDGILADGGGYIIHDNEILISNKYGNSGVYIRSSTPSDAFISIFRNKISAPEGILIGNSLINLVIYKNTINAALSAVSVTNGNRAYPLVFLDNVLTGSRNISSNLMNDSSGYLSQYMKYRILQLLFKQLY